MDHPDARTPPGLYIHIPFCLKKCDYCGFYSVTDWTLIPDFLAALRREMGPYRNPEREFDTVYIGGGTPSVLDPADLTGLIADLRAAFTIQPAAEITIEVNPGDITIELLSALRCSGVNRLNIGCQSFDDTVLAFLGRRHTARQAREAVEMARSASFDNIGLDLIYGLPGQSVARWLEILAAALAVRPDHLSCYQLTVEAGTPLAERCRKNEVVLPDDDLQSRLFFQTSEFLERAGYLHYEVSNFAGGDRFRSRHNSKYWNHVSYLGLGPAAHSFDGRKRWWNHRSVPAYLKALSDGKSPIAGSEKLSDQDLRLEALFLGFRTQRGINLEDFKRRYGQDLLNEKHEFLLRLINEDLVEIRDGFLRPTRAGMAVADSLALI